MVWTINTLGNGTAEPFDKAKTYDGTTLMMDADDQAEAESRYDALLVLAQARAQVWRRSRHTSNITRGGRGDRLARAREIVEHAMRQVRTPLFCN